MEAKIGKHILMFLGNQAYPHDTRVYPEAVCLAKAGFDVSVISPKLPSQTIFEKSEGVTAYRYPAPPELESVLGYALEYGWVLFWTALYAVFILFRRGFDVVHAHNPPDVFVLLALLLKPLGKKFVFDHHDLSVDLYRARAIGGGNKRVIALLTWFEKKTCQTADLIITTNGSYKRLDAERHQIPLDRIKVVRNGANLKLLQIVEPRPELVSLNKCLIGFVGGMGPQDGADNMLRALNHLRYTLGREDFFGIFVGDGSESNDLEALAAKLGLEDCVAFVGEKSGQTLNEYYSSLDIGIEPTAANTFNSHSTMIKVMEYMAFATPLVAFDLIEHRVTAKQAAIYVPNNDVHEMALQIARLMDDPALRDKMGSFGRKRVLEKLTWQHSEAKLIEAYYHIFPKKEARQLFNSAFD